jgi:predicted nucleotidyltransferase
MPPIPLLATTGHPRIDATLRGIIGLYEIVFPGRISGYYVIGSYADGNPVPTSDLDGLILFKGNFVDQ